MKRSLRAWLAVGLAAMSAAPSSPAEGAQDAGRPLRVLFIGNSYTYYNNVPCLVSAIARSRGRAIDAELQAVGGFSLADHWQRAETQAALRRPWDAIVLQTQSTFRSTFYVSGVNRIDDTSALLPETQPFATPAIRGRARLYLLSHWKRLAAPERDQHAIDHAFHNAAQALQAKVIPSGSAFERAAASMPREHLYDADGSHPSPSGSYLSALTIYAALTGETPVGAAAAISCPNVDPDAGAPAGPLQIAIAETSSRQMQHAAMQALQASSTGAPAADPIALPLPPKDTGRDPGALEGEWSGTTELYPRSLPWPAKMHLAIGRSSKGTLTISFGGRPDDIVRDVTLSRAGGVVAFEDPAGPNKTVIKYRGALEQGELIGVAEFTGNVSLRGVGRWTLRRVKAATP